MALPENIGLLKKMGDCYLTMDQLEAANEAYRQLIKKTSEHAAKVEDAADLRRQG